MPLGVCAARSRNIARRCAGWSGSNRMVMWIREKRAKLISATRVGHEEADAGLVLEEAREDRVAGEIIGLWLTAECGWGGGGGGAGCHNPLDVSLFWSEVCWLCATREVWPRQTAESPPSGPLV